MMAIKKNIPLAPYTTFRIGGPAKYFAEAKSKKEIQELCHWANEKGAPILVLGGGSNILISDKGFNGLVMKIQNLSLRDISRRETKFVSSGHLPQGGKIQNSDIYAEAGVPLAKLVLESGKAGLSGLEWAIGIPGTVGGAINGNSGAFGKSIGEVVESVEALEIDAMQNAKCKAQNENFPPKARLDSAKRADQPRAEKLKIKRLNKKECRFGYRESIFKRNFNFIILSAIFRLQKGKEEKIRETMKEFNRQRAESNPLGYSAGCFFKNIGWKEVRDRKKLIAKFPELRQFSGKPKISTGFLIENLGLKGKRIGGAVVSDKHANFILNAGRAKAKDVFGLASLIRMKVRKRYGFELEEEVVTYPQFYL